MWEKKVTFGLIQFPVIKGSIELNIKKHIEYIELAVKNGADIVVFPELSLTGYEPELASELAIDIESDYISQLSTISKKTNAIVICGCPIKSTKQQPYIGALISFPSGETDLYRKQFLHTGEFDYFIKGKDSYFFNCKGHKIALAICADFCNPKHPEEAKFKNADVYLASVLISYNGFDADNKQLQNYAFQHNFVVLMSNHNGETGGWKACGKSRAWSSDGKLAVASENNDSSIVLCTVLNGQVKGNIVRI